MTASDDARKAMEAWLDGEREWDDILDALMPDGRTIAQHLDNGSTAMTALRALVQFGRIESQIGPWMAHSPVADLIARLEAEQ